MNRLKALGGPLVTLAVIVGAIVALRVGPSLIWPKQSTGLVQDEGFEAGHQHIGINEDAVRKDENTLLFSTLKKWHFDPARPSSPPGDIKEYDNRFVCITGFMHPLEQGKKIKLFRLVRSTETCCEGHQPKPNHCVLVEMDQPVPFLQHQPVEVQGTFFVDPNPEGAYIYRMEATRAAAAKG